MAISLRAARVNANLKQTDVAESLKISKSTIQNYENYRTSPSVEMSLKLAKLYGLDLDDIIFLK